MPKKKNIFLLPAFILSFAFLSCKEDESEITGTAEVSLTNAALNSVPADLYVDELKITPSSVSYTNTTGISGNPYLEMNAGIRSVKIISTASPEPVVEGNLVITPGGNYSIFMYDTLDTFNHLKALIVSDNLTAPSTGKSKVRFFNLSPDSKYLDMHIFRTDDTTKLTGVAYVGNTAGTTGLSAFREINTGLFGLTVKQTDSTNNLITGQSFNFEEGKMYSIYVRGKIANGVNTTQGFNISTVQHN